MCTRIGKSPRIKLKTPEFTKALERMLRILNKEVLDLDLCYNKGINTVRKNVMEENIKSSLESLGIVSQKR